ncbi:hypothetical protein [Methylibium sp.]|uniref:hypothetical protein n=1 Tax=Methylibium sp. TaxID=2067992 RepID=UPI003BA8C24B
MGVHDGRGRWRARGAGLFALIAVGEVLAGPFTPVTGQEYREVIDPPTQVQGQAVVGTALVGVQSQVGAQSLYARAKTSFIGQVRVSLTTADGRLRGDGAFQGEAREGEWIELELKPKDGKRLRPNPLAPERVAVSVRYVENGSSVEQPMVAAWEVPSATATAATLRLYVNSRRAPEMLVMVKGRQPQLCRRAPDKSTVRFDMLCELPLSSVVGSKGKVTLVRRDGFDELEQPVVVGW